MNKVLTLFVLMPISWSALALEDARETPKPIQFYVGFQPMITAEPFDDYRQTVDINLLPVLFEYAVDRRWSARISPVMNLQLRPELPSAISRVGVGITLPYHLSKKNDEEGNRGFYAGPLVIAAKHKTDGFNSITGGAEIGFAFLLGQRFSITIGAQVGQTVMFLKDLGYNRIAPHTGALFCLGYWF